MSSPGLDTVRAFLLDLDGVLYRGSQRLPGAVELVDALRAASIPFLVMTNNATSTPDQVAARLNAMGIAVDRQQVFSSAMATTAWLRQRYPAGSRVLYVGETGLRTALADGGLRLVDSHQQAEVVVAALDRTVTYARLAEATLAINAGCPFVATNPDRNIPTERGVEPGAGAIQALLEASTGVAPVVIGKPQTAFFELAMERLGCTPQETVMVGDRYDTDILGGARAGIRTMAVLTGISTAEELAAADFPPTWVFADLVELLAAWSAAAAQRILS